MEKDKFIIERKQIFEKDFGTSNKIGNQDWSNLIKNTKTGDIYFNYKEALEIEEYFKKEGWRLPTDDDFMDLDVSLGCTGRYQVNDIENHKLVMTNYFKKWNLQLNGYKQKYNEDIALLCAGDYACFWLKEDDINTFVFKRKIYEYFNIYYNYFLENFEPNYNYNNVRLVRDVK